MKLREDQYWLRKAVCRSGLLKLRLSVDLVDVLERAGDRSQVELDAARPVLDVAQLLQLVVEPVDKLKPILSLEKLNRKNI